MGVGQDEGLEEVGGLLGEVGGGGVDGAGETEGEIEAEAVAQAAEDEDRGAVAGAQESHSLEDVLLSAEEGDRVASIVGARLRAEEHDLAAGVEDGGESGESLWA